MPQGPEGDPEIRGRRSCSCHRLPVGPRARTLRFQRRWSPTNLRFLRHFSLCVRHAYAMRNRRAFSVLFGAAGLLAAVAARQVSPNTRAEALTWPWATTTVTTTGPQVPVGSSWSSLGEPGVGGWLTSISVSPIDSNRVLVGGDMLGVALSTDSGSTWQSTSGMPSYEMAEFTWHPTSALTVWAGSMSGPLRSVNGGKTWASMRGGMPAEDYCYSAPIERVLFDAGNSNHLLAFGGSQRRWDTFCKDQLGTVWDSANGGTTWTKLATIQPQGSIVAATFLAGSRSTLVAAVADKGMFRSTDAGKTWVAVNSGLPHLNVTDVIANPRNANVLWATLESGPNGETGFVVKSTNGGQSWVALAGGLPAELLTHLEIA